MRINSNKKWKSLIMCVMLVVTMAFTSVGCDQKKKSSTEKTTSQSSTKNENEDKVLGEGSTKFTCIVIDKDGNETNFEINTDKKTVGEALLEVGLIDGENGEFGIYVKSVNGIVADYDVDKTYWAFYVNGEYAMTGIDSTDVEEGATYSLKVEK